MKNKNIMLYNDCNFKKKMKFISLIIQFLCFYSINARVVKPLEPLVPSEDYTHSLDVDEDRPSQYLVLWKLVNKDEIQFEIHVKTNGWIGMGISPNGGMAGNDYFIYFERKLILKNLCLKDQM